MALIHKGKSALTSSARKYLLLSGAFLMPLLVYGYVFIVYHYYLPGFWHLAPMVLFGWPSAYFWKKYQIRKNGVRGEAAALKALKNLPDDYHVFNNITLCHEGRQRELDTVVVGHNGVFIVEVKNHNGSISGDTEAESWTQHKIGRRGGKYDKEMRNPVKQVKGQVYVLAKLLQKADMTCWVEGMVYFSHPNVRLELNGLVSAITHSPDMLTDYIVSYHPRQVLSDKAVLRISQYLRTKQIA